MRRRQRGFKRAFDKNGSDTLSDRAVTTGLLYNYLEYVSPKDVDGVKRAYVKVQDHEVSGTPIEKDKASVAQMYGYKPTIVASKKEPMALITRFSPKDKMFPQLEEFGNELLRSALRKIVDEV